MSQQSINLTAAELQAIEDHKYFLSQQRGEEVTIEEAIDDFIRHYADDWRREKLRRDNLEQRQEIEKHLYLRSQEEGRDIGRSSAAQEWCQKYAHIWRAERESLQRNGFKSTTVVVKDPQGLHVRPVSAVAALAVEYDCDIYVHRDGMAHYNFTLDQRQYLNVRSILGFLSMGAKQGDTLEFIVTGAQADEALQALKILLSEQTPA